MAGSSLSGHLGSDSHGRFALQSLRRTLLWTVRGLAFWIAVVLPFIYIPLLVVGIDSVQMLVAFVALVAVNVCALLVGQSYDDDRR